MVFGVKSRYDRIELHPAEAANLDDYKGVWVIVEQRQDRVQDVTLELLGAARPMAEKLGCEVTAVLLCESAGDMPEALIAHGADKVIVAADPILKTPLARPSTDVLVRLVKERKPEIVLIGATHTGRDVSSRVAVKIDAGMTADCTELDVDAHNGELLARRPAFGGKMLATIRCDRHRPQMATARPGIFVPQEADPSRTGDVETYDASFLRGNDYAAEVLDHYVDEGKVDITKADVLVAVGLGVGGPEGVEVCQELADALGGKLAASRPVCDKGWVPRGQQVGQTGLSVRPKFYVAVGVSGAIQHIEGIKEAGTVLAINNDPNAQIFQYADLGIVGDWRGAVQGLIKEAKSRGLAGKKWLVPVKDTLDADRQAAAERAAKAGKTEASAAPAKTEPPGGKTAAANGSGTVQVEQPAARAAPETAAVEAPSEAALPEVEEGKEPAAPEAPAPAAPEAEPAEAASAEYTGDPNDADAVKAWVKQNVPEEKKAWVVAADCIVCNGCEAACPTGAAVVTDMAKVDRDLCIADGACFDACPTDAIRPGVEDEATSAGWPEGSRRHGEFGV